MPIDFEDEERCKNEIYEEQGYAAAREKMADMFASLGEDIIEASKNIADAIDNLADIIYAKG